MRRVLLGIAFLGLSASGLAQTPTPRPTPQKPSFRSSVELLAIDVTVSDKSGNPVRDLKPDDFIVEVGGKRRAVVRSDFIDFSDRAAASAPRAIPDEVASNQVNTRAPDPRTILLLVDDESFTVPEGRPVFLKLADMMATAFPGDAVGFSVLSGRAPAVEFTMDRRPVVDALRNLMGRRVATGTQTQIAVVEALEIARGNAFTMDRVLERESQSACAGIGGVSPRAAVGSVGSANPCSRLILSDAIAMTEDIHASTHRTLRAFARHFENLGRLPGIKYVILVSQGIFLDEDIGIAEEMARIAAAASVTLQVIHVDRQEVGDVTRARTSPRASEDVHVRGMGLESVAAAAGGTVERTFVDPEPAFERVRRDVATVYRLAVESLPEDETGKTRPIDVKTTRAGLTTHTHRQVVVPERSAAVDPAARLQRALESPAIERGIPLRMAVFGYRSEGGGGNIVVSAEADAPADGLRFAYAVRNESGKATVASEVAPQSITVEQGQAPLVVFRTTAPLGDYTVKLAAIDAEGRIGSVTQMVSLPRAQTPGFALGDLIVLPGETDVLHARPAPHIPKGTREAGVYFELYSGGTSPATLATIVLEISNAQTGESLGSTRAQVTLTRSADYAETAGRVRFSPAALPPGDYTVTLSIDGTPVKAARGFTVE